MSLNNASVLSGGTMVTPTGGSALPFSSLGIRNNTNTLYATGDTDLRTRRSIVCTVKEPRVSSGAPNGYTQARRTAVIKVPIVLTNGNITVNTIRTELSVDVETSVAEINEMETLASQLLSDADFADFFEDGSLS